MKITRSITNIAAVCTKEQSRYGFNNPNLVRVVDKRYLCATNGKALVFRRVEEALDDALGPVPVEVLERVRKILGKKRSSSAPKEVPVYVRDGKAEIPWDSERQVIELPEPKPFPDVSNFVPDRESKEHVFSAIFNRETLVSLLEALDSECVEFSFQRPIDRPVRVDACEAHGPQFQEVSRSSGDFGMLMQVGRDEPRRQDVCSAATS